LLKIRAYFDLNRPIWGEIGQLRSQWSESGGQRDFEFRGRELAAEMKIKNFPHSIGDYCGPVQRGFRFWVCLVSV